MQGLELVLTLLVIAAGLAPLARRIGVPFPVVLVVGGLALALIPGLPAVELAPDVVFLIFVPPLLFWAALTTSPRELRRNVRPIGFLAIGLVLVTAAAVAAVAHAVVPGVPWAAAFVLGAVVSPPDAAAAISVARGLGVAPRLVTLLEGETLMNDTTAFVTYRMAVAAAVTGTFSLGAAALRFVLIGLGGIATGALVGYALVWLLRFARQPAVANTLALLTPFAAYLPAERGGPRGCWRW
jgi:NhaP-type Na+/H+ or K+/H+ antiporter